MENKLDELMGALRDLQDGDSKSEGEAVKESLKAKIQAVTEDVGIELELTAEEYRLFEGQGNG